MTRRYTYKRHFILYHWAPVARRKSIQKQGIRIKKPLTCHCDQGDGWTAHYSCWSDSPSLAWALSARFVNEPGEWDLWMVWSNVPKTPLGRRDDLGKRNYPSEYRIFENIPVRHLWHCGTKTMTPRKRIRAEQLQRGRVVPKSTDKCREK